MVADPRMSSNAWKFLGVIGAVSGVTFLAALFLFGAIYTSTSGVDYWSGEAPWSDTLGVVSAALVLAGLLTMSIIEVFRYVKMEGR